MPVLEILRAQGVIACAPAPMGPIADELSSYDAHMSSARGLAAGTRRGRLRIVERLLLSKFAGRPLVVSSLLPEDVRQFIVDQLQALGTTSNAITIASTLRAYLRYRATCGDAVQPLLAQAGLTDKLWIIGGNLPRQDHDALRGLGFKGVFPTGSRLDEITGFIERNLP